MITQTETPLIVEVESSYLRPRRRDMSKNIIEDFLEKGCELGRVDMGRFPDLTAKALYSSVASYISRNGISGVRAFRANGHLYLERVERENVNSNGG